MQKLKQTSEQTFKSTLELRNLEEEVKKLNKLLDNQ